MAGVLRKGRARVPARRILSWKRLIASSYPPGNGTAGTVALIGYTGSYIADHFANQVAAPVLLMMMGFLLIGAGAAAVWINTRYIRRADRRSQKAGEDGSRSSGAPAGA